VEKREIIQKMWEVLIPCVSEVSKFKSNAITFLGERKSPQVKMTRTQHKGYMITTERNNNKMNPTHTSFATARALSGSAVP
jgi:hypothetical protein